MKRRDALLLLVAAVPAYASAQSVASLTSAAKDPLMKMITSQLGVTESQAQGGVGSYLSLLQGKLAKGDFDKIAALVPGASSYIETAKKLGAITGPLTDLAGLNASLGKIGFNAETAAQFVPMVTGFLGKAGGSSVENLLTSALK